MLGPDQTNLLPAKVNGGTATCSTGESWRVLAACSQLQARAFIPRSLALSKHILPVAVLQFSGQVESITVVAGRDISPAEKQEIRFIAGTDIIWERVEETNFELAILAAYDGGADVVSERIARAESAKLSGRRSLATPDLLQSIVEHAVISRASDIHFNLSPAGVEIRQRIDGELRDGAFPKLTLQLYDELVRRLKILSGLDITERRRPLDGATTISCLGEDWCLRIACIPGVLGERVVLRLFPWRVQDTGEISSKLHPDFSERQELAFGQALHATQGLILLSGPTGSGKSTLLYRAVSHLVARGLHVVTIEDPVERLLPGTLQCEVKRDAQLGFADFVKASLRQDPDVLLIGEIRDGATADAAISAAMTGHLVLSSVHAPSAPEALLRLLDLGVSGSSLTATAVLSTSQRLLAANCLNCKTSVAVPSAFRKLFQLTEEHVMWKGVGCPACEGTGLRGRVAVFEFGPCLPPIRNLLSQASTLSFFDLVQELRSAFQESGFEPLSSEVRKLLMRGVLSPWGAMEQLGISPQLVGFGPRNR